MFPDNVLSSEVVKSPFLGAKSLQISRYIDYENGGITLNDPSQGLFYQIWRCRLLGNDVVIDATYVDESILYSDTGISEISFTFDQNMRPILAFVKDGFPYLRWYDSAVGHQVVTALDPTIITPRVSLDDKRSSQSSISDIILAYIRSGNLCWRLQRDRFLIEYISLATLSPGLIKIGMNTKYRFQFMLQT